MALSEMKKPITHNVSVLSPPTTATLPEKLATKNGRAGPSPFRQLLPVALCLISFATVLSMLMIYMDTTGEYEN